MNQIDMKDEGANAKRGIMVRTNNEDRQYFWALEVMDDGWAMEDERVDVIRKTRYQR